jgi:hypothetical protein
MTMEEIERAGTSYEEERQIIHNAIRLLRTHPDAKTARTAIDGLFELLELHFRKGDEK